MKLICIEEHAVDAGLAAAIQPAQMAEAGYMLDWGSRVEDYPEGTDRPRQVSGRDALARARDLGEGRLEMMDRHGIDMQIVSYSNPAQLAPREHAAALTRSANDALATAVRAHPDRLRAFAVLPWQDPAAAAAELERCVREHRMLGALLQGRPGKTFLDDPFYEPVLAKLSQLGVPLYVHPGFPLPEVRQPYYGGLDKEVSARLSLFAWGWHNESGVQVVRMILAGVFDRFPGLQIISGHWGEMVPFFLQRLDDTLPLAATRLKRSVTETYRQHVYVTPSGMMNTPHFEFTYKVLGADRILYSVDYPYVTLDGARSFIENLNIPAQDKNKIAHGNAESLFGLSI